MNAFYPTQAGQYYTTPPPTDFHNYVKTMKLNQDEIERLKREIKTLESKHATANSEKKAREEIANVHERNYESSKQDLLNISKQLESLQRVHNLCGGKLRQATEEHKKEIERLKQENANALATVQSQHGGNHKHFIDEIDKLKKTIEKKDAEHKQEMAFLRHQKEEAEAKLRQAHTDHESIKKTHGEHENASVIHQRDMHEKKEEIASLKNEITKLHEELEKGEKEINEIKVSRSRALVRNIVPVAFQAQKNRYEQEKSEIHANSQEIEARLKNEHRITMARREQEYAETIQGIKGDHSKNLAEIQAGTERKKGIWGIPNFFKRSQPSLTNNGNAQKQRPTSSPAQSEKTAQDHLKDHLDIYEKYLKEEENKYDVANGDQQARIDPEKRKMRKMKVMENAEALFIASQGGRTPKHYDLVNRSERVKGLNQHFAFNDIISSGGGGGLYCARM